MLSARLTVYIQCIRIHDIDCPCIHDIDGTRIDAIHCTRIHDIDGTRIHDIDGTRILDIDCTLELLVLDIILHSLGKDNFSHYIVHSELINTKIGEKNPMGRYSIFKIAPLA